ncbi:MAG: hypothetical protein SCALA702_20500 [Melioribacteraceae bacterium]|nr:MAG: hypothetical protein SCALA702_20500 [Melioribacteraceae bacterium]
MIFTLRGILASLVLFMTLSIHAQNPRITWKTTDWQKNIKEIASYEADGKNFVLMISTKGTAWIYELNENGEIGDQTWKTTNWEKGIECASTFKIGSQNYVFLLNGRNGHAWLLQLNANGKVGKFTWDRKKKGWVKNLDEAVVAKVGNKDFAIFSQNDKKGHIWVAPISSDGKLGKFSDKQKRSYIRNMSTFNQNGKTYLFTHSTKGEVQINEITSSGKIGKRTWGSRGWGKNTNASTVFNYGGTNHLMLVKGETGEAHIFDITKNAQMGTIRWKTSSWEKGIQGLTSYTKNGIPRVMATNPRNGHAWTFVNVGYIPNSISDGSLKKTYTDLINGQKKISKIADDLQWGSVATLKSADKIDYQIERISRRLEDYSSALEGFGKVPIIGSAAVAARVTINTSADQVNKVKGKSENINKVAVKPTLGNANKTLGAINKAETNVLAILSKLISIDNGTASNSGGKTAKIKRFDSQINEALNKISSESNKVTQINSTISKVKKPIDTYNKSIDKLVSKLKNVDKVVNGVNKALNKSFKKKVLGKTFKVSARKILTGGKVGKAIQKVANKWAKKLMKPLVKKLKFNLPSVPGIDSVKKELETIKKTGEDFVNLRKGIEASADKLVQINSGI